MMYETRGSTSKKVEEVFKTFVLIFSNANSSDIYNSIIEVFAKKNVQVHAVFLGEDAKPIQTFAESIGIEASRLREDRRFSKILNVIRLVSIMRKYNSKTILCFGQRATLVGFTAAILLPGTQRIYSRQHTSSNRLEFPVKGFLYDSFCNFFANLIIVSCHNQFKYLVDHEKVRSDKLRLCPFGFNLEQFSSVEMGKVESFREEFDLKDFDMVVGVVARLTHIKGIHYIIDGFRNYLTSFPNSCLLLANAFDSSARELEILTSKISKNNFRIIPWQQDMSYVYATMDVLVHAPISNFVESYGLVYVEAFASGIPCIITKSGIARDIASNMKNAIVVDYRNGHQIASALKQLAGDEQLRASIGQSARLSVAHLDMRQMKNAYGSLIDELRQNFYTN